MAIEVKVREATPEEKKQAEERLKKKEGKRIK